VGKEEQQVMTRRLSRREFLRDAAIFGGVALTPAFLESCHVNINLGSDSTGWGAVPGILERIVPPTFPKRDFLLTQFGGAGDGTTDNTAALSSAIAACNRAGGGRVVVPPGRFLTGAIHLKSNVNLFVSDGATLLFSTDPSHYLPVVLTRFEGVEVMNYSPLIYALDCENIAITGTGTLDGQADNEHWWPWKGNADFGWKKGDPNQVAARTKLFDMAEKGVAVGQRVFGDGGYMRPAFIEPYHCRNVLIEGVRIINSPMWEIHPTLSTNVMVRGVHISTHGPNNDGCDPESCTDVLIDNCFFDTGDDCIAIKSGRNADGRRIARPSANIIVRNCTMRDGHGGVTIGSEISGGVRNVYAEDCVMDSPSLDRALRLKNNAARGGKLEHIYMRNVTVGQVAAAVLEIDFLYEEGANGAFTPVARDVELNNVKSGKSNYGVYIRGIDKGMIDDIRIIHCTFDNVVRGNVIEHAGKVTFTDSRMNGQVVNT
jgi:polygalacturonase